MNFAFLAFPDQSGMLESELKNRFSIDASKGKHYGDLVYFENLKEFETFYEQNLFPYWARTAMLDAKTVKIASIGDAAKILKSIQRNWACYPYTQFRRSSLISEKLPYIKTKERQFPFKIPSSSMGLFTLLDETTMLFSEKTTSFLPAGLLKLIEDHENPPSRAYLKLEEALIRFTSVYDVELPDSESRCFDAGACPGGWSWVLRMLDCSVLAVDRSELAESLMNDGRVEFLRHDAFTLKPEEIGPFDFVFSDVICYPERLYDWINLWIESGKTKNMICTIKMQGEIDWNLMEKFHGVPNSHIVHLCVNKHELTFMWSAFPKR